MSLEERVKYAEMKARHQKRLRPWYKKWWGVIIIIILSLVLILFISSSIYIIKKVQEIRSGESSALSSQEVQKYLEEIKGDGSNYYLGTSTPELTLIEFGDFSCPHCQDASPVVNDLAKKYGDKLKIVWRDYLINSNSIDLAMAARCAGEQGKFWPMHDSLFAHRKELLNNDSSRPQKLINLAQNLNLNIKKFSDCLSNQTYLDQIKKDYYDGNALKIPGTPTWFIKNHSLSGYIPENKFDTLIKGLLK